MTHYKEYTIIPIVIGSLGSCRILSMNRRTHIFRLLGPETILYKAFRLV